MILKNKHYHRNIFDEVESVMSQQPYALTHFFKILVHLLIAVLVLATKLHNSALLFAQSLRYLQIPALLDLHGDLCLKK
jgi:hypothetical protein